ncbi:hypothetical protein [uncultured Methanobrevibacter sp.]|uniref:hypothetical protein n=1 Tax=uncultured Methanobrevibacter sp. TaxID=253161 RepID=UPI0025DE901C|nr:hypothetical protein [uncultured Methanobrevibacter sp.]
MIDWIIALFFFIVVIACCCASDGDSSKSTTTKRKTTNTTQRNTHYANHAYSECPSCGAPYFDGYCGECGYPDINQGWLGEEY